MRKSMLRVQLFIVISFIVAGVLYIDRRITNTDKYCSCENKVDERSKPALETVMKELIAKSTATIIADTETNIKEKVQITDDEWSKTWPRVNLKNCSHREFMNRGINSPNIIKNLPYMETGIMSYPGSGNTWTRFLIEQATGLYTGSEYRDGALYKGGFKGEMEDPKLNSTVGVKDHGQAGRVHERVILVIRDPHRSLMSEFNRLHSDGSHVKGANDSVLESGDWEKYLLNRSAKMWSRSSIGYIKMYMNTSNLLNKEQNPFTAPPGQWKRLLLVSYERLKMDANVELERIVKFLGIPTFRKHCLQENKQGNFRRPPKSTEKIACSYNKPELQKVMEKTKKFMFDKGRIIGAGNLLAEIKETYTIENNKTCFIDKSKVVR